MSLQVNLASTDLAQAYQDVLNARGIDWCMFTYEKGSNDLKVQSTGNGGLEELEEEFSDARRVLTTSMLTKLTVRFRTECSMHLFVSRTQT